MKKSPIFLVFVLSLFLVSCAGTQQTRSVEQSGFLGDYSMLREGEDDEALRIYKNPKTDWKSYTKVIIEPVQIWKDRGTKDVDPEDLQRLADDLWSKIATALNSDYKIVHQPGPGVMRIAAAITEAEASNPVADTVSSVVPQLRILTGTKGLIAGGKPGFVGAASAEMKITDASSGELLAAGVDRRAGTKNLSGMTNSWNDVEEAYQYWAGKLKWRLCLLRGGSSCEEPKA